VAPIPGGRESERAGDLIDRKYGCGCVRAAVDEGTGEVVKISDTKPPARLARVVAPPSHP